MEKLSNCGQNEGMAEIPVLGAVGNLHMKKTGKETG